MEKSKVALVLEGGGLRGSFTAGVVDCFLDNNVDFDYVCGVSAGSCNTLAYVAKCRGFFKRCILQSNKRDSFFGVQQMTDSHKLVDLDKVFNAYTDKYGFSYDDFISSDVDWDFVVSNIETGKPEYVNSKDKKLIKKMGKASCSMPILTKPVEINGKLYLDGGLTDSVPIQRAIDKGYDKIVVVCTRKKGSFSSVKKYELPIYKNLYSKYPKFVKAAEKRGALYKKQIALCEELEKQGNVILIRPTMPEISRLESDLNEISLSYYHGYTKAKEYVDQIKKW